MSSAYLNAAQRSGLAKLGDVMIPGDGELPSFTAAGCLEHVDRFLESLEPGDRKGLATLLTLVNLMPRLAVRGLVVLLESFSEIEGAPGAAPRMALLGIKGVVMTLYYSDLGGQVFDAIGWDARCGEPIPSPAAAPGEQAGASGDRVGQGARPSAAAGPPYDGHPLPPVAPAADTPLEQAVERARAAQRAIRSLSLEERLRFLRRLRHAVVRRREEIVDRIQRDTAKSRSDALISEVYGVLENLHWLETRAAKHLAPEKVDTPLALMGKQSWLWYEPAGVVLVIAPWNYPFYQAMVPLAFAFAAGNAVIHKPSEWTPLTGLLEDLLAEAQFSPSWAQVVYGDGAAGSALIEQRPDRVFFTGSTRTGRRVLEVAAKHLIPVELELGGKDAMIVFGDADVHRAAAGAAWGAFTCTGQSCTSVERLYVHESIYEPFKQALLEQTRAIKQEVDSDGDADIGTMAVDFQARIVAEHVAEARAGGAGVLTGGEWDGHSTAIPPIVLEDVRDDMKVASEETFGPVLPLFRFTDEEDVIRRANASPYGLTASVWSKDLERAKRVAAALEVGGVSINNVMLTEGNPALPFGGVKQSGFGRFKGAHGLRAFSNLKSVLIDKDSKKIEANWYPYTREKYALFGALTESQFGDGVRAFVRFVLAGLRLERYSQKAKRQ